MDVQTLFVRITADINELQRKLEKASKLVKEHGEGFEQLGKTIAVAGTVVSGSITAMVYQYASLGGALDDMSKRTGFSAEALSRLSYAAEQNGASMGTLEIAIRLFQRRLTEASQSSGEMERSFSRLGINVEELKSLKPEEQFQRLLLAVAAIKDPTERASAAMEVFGRSGTMILPMLADGEEGLRRLMEEADKLGIVMDTKAAAAADALGDSFTATKKAALGLAVQVGSVLQPFMMGVTKTMTDATVKVKDWTAAHPELARTVGTAAVAIGTLTAGVGGFLMMMGKVMSLMPLVVQGFVALRAAVAATLGPIGLVAAAATTTYVTFTQLTKAKDAAMDADLRLQQQEIQLANKLKQAADAAGMTRAEFFKLTEKYNGNIAALAMAIKRGQEGAELQKALAEVGAKHAEAIDKQREAQEKANRSKQEAILQDAEAKSLLEQITSLRQTLTDIIARGTMEEVQYSKWAIQTEYAERKKFIEEAVKDEQTKSELLALLAQARAVQINQIEQKAAAERKALMAAEVEALRQASDEMVAMHEARQSFLETSYKDITARLNQVTMERTQFQLWSLQQEVQAEIEKINSSLLLNQAHKDALIAMWQEYLAVRTAQIQSESDEWTSVVNETASIIENTLTGAFTRTLDVMRNWAEQGGSVLNLLGGIFKSLAEMATKALADIALAMVKSAIKEVAANKAKAIASVISSVMRLPFPLNLALVGGAIAAVTALFSKIKLAEGGIVTKPTMALVGEKGPEAVIPLKNLPALATAGVSVNVNIYGDINNAGTVDEISERLAFRLDSMLRGRRW